nr:hypothetical protein [Tanacetum cinerariifolium]
MLVQQQVQDNAEVQKDEDDNEVSTAPTPPSLTPATTPPPPQQEPIPSPPQAQSAQPSSPPQQQPSKTTDISMTLLNTSFETCVTLTKKVVNLEQDKIAQALETVKLKQRVRKRMHLNKGKIVELDADEDVTLEDVEPAVVEEVIEVVTTTKLMTEVVTTAAPITTAAQVPKPSAPRKRRGVVIQDPEETAATLIIMHSEDVLEQVKKREKQDNTVMTYQALKRKPLTEARARKRTWLDLRWNSSRMILLVEKKYLLTHFTLEQMLNNVRLKVKEKSEMSLELLSQRTHNVDEYVVSESVTSVSAIATNKVKTSELKPKSVSEPLIKDYISNSEDENENENATKYKKRKPSFTKVEFVKPNEQVKSPRESVKQEEQNRQAKHPRKNSQSPRVLMRCGFKTLNTARQNSSRVVVSVNTARQIKTAYPRPTVNSARPMGNITTAGPRAVLNDNNGNKVNVVKASACWVWRPKNKVLDHVFRNNGASITLKKFDYGNLQFELQEKGFINSRCSRHMTGNMSYLSEYEEIDGGYVAFGGDPKGGKITGKGKISTGKFDGKADEGLLIRYSTNSKAFRVFNNRTRIVEENLHVKFSKNTPNIAGSGPNWLFDIHALTKSMNYKPVVVGIQSNGSTGGKKDTEDPWNEESEVPITKELRVNQKKDSFNSTNRVNAVSSTVNAASNEVNAVGKKSSIELLDDPNMSDLDHPVKQIIRDIHSTPQTRMMTKSVTNHDGCQECVLYGKIKEEVYVYQPTVFEDPEFPDKFYKVDNAIYGLHQAPRAWSPMKEMCTKFEKTIHKKFQMSSMGVLTFFLGLQTTSTPMETSKPLMKDENAKDVDIHLCRSMIGSLMYLTSSRPDIMFVVCAFARFQVTPKVSHLHAVERIFRYFKGQPKLGLWYPKDSPFDLEAYTDSDYDGASLDRKSTKGGCQFLRSRLILWQCKKQTIVANSTTEAKLYTNNDFNEVKQLLRMELRLTLAYTYYCQLKVNAARHKLTTAVDVTVKAKNINREAYIRAKVDEKRLLSLKQQLGEIFSLKMKEELTAYQMKSSLNNFHSWAQEEELGEGSTMPFAPQHIQTIIQPSTSKPQKKQKPRKSKQKDTQETQPNDPKDEALNEENRVKRLNKKRRSRTHGLKILYKIGLSSRVESSAKEQKDQGRYDDQEMFDTSVLDDEEEVLLKEAQDVQNVVKSTRPKARGVVMKDPSETPTTTTIPKSSKVQDKGKARRLQDEIDEQDRLAEEKAQLIEDENLAWDNVQAMMDADYELAARLQEEEQGELTIK